ncbi:MAG: DUF1294 domain-containing protein [Planctomycetota bacterium]
MGRGRSAFLANPVRATLVPGVAVAAAGAWLAEAKAGAGTWPLGWFAGISVAAYLTWWIDKRQAKRDGHRVPEWTLHALSALGGGVAALLAMRTLRHKTRKRVFKLAHPVLAALSVAALGYLGYAAR